MSDLISRQDAIDEVKTMVMDLMIRLENLSTAESKKGRWIKDENGFVCSECGYRSILKPFALVEQDGEMEQVAEMNFCYKCGADMRE